MQKNPAWKVRVQELLNVCHDEIKKTTEIGKKMLSASRTNTCLHDAYEELGQLTAEALESGELKWENAKAQELINTISSCEKDLELIDSEVSKIKFAAGPEMHKGFEKDDKSSNGESSKKNKGTHN